ncbi:MAG TPA: TetR/AcrR family transcriptional regulator [Firmicutes bacterium]|jgi:TetR/AcrR family transcriptional regulator, transcriptional repressor for nem operon|nr:TetR/AcrR family transcriptional regulator [Bacillota bacterium]
MSDTKEHIMKISLNLFLQKSFKEVTMQDIVKKTGMSKGAFYHYFESKEQFFLEVVNYFKSALVVDYSKLSKDSLYQFYHEYIKSLQDEIMYSFSPKADSNFNLNYYLLIFDAMKLFPSFREEMNTYFHDEQKFWEKIIHIAKDKGEITSSMPEQQIASIFIHMSDGVVMRSILKDVTEDTANTLLNLWDGLYTELRT